MVEDSCSECDRGRRLSGLRGCESSEQWAKPGAVLWSIDASPFSESSCECECELWSRRPALRSKEKSGRRLPLGLGSRASTRVPPRIEAWGDYTRLADGLDARAGRGRAPPKRTPSAELPEHLIPSVVLAPLTPHSSRSRSRSRSSARLPPRLPVPLPVAGARTAHAPCRTIRPRPSPPWP